MYVNHNGSSRNEVITIKIEIKLSFFKNRNNNHIEVFIGVTNKIDPKEVL